MTTWIDFRELRERATMNEVLNAYQIELKIRGERATGFCPLPGHVGERKSPSFSVHLGKQLFNCFSCKRGGNCIDLVALLEGLEPSDPAAVRTAALKLAEICGIRMNPPKRNRERQRASLPPKRSIASSDIVSGTFGVEQKPGGKPRKETSDNQDNLKTLINPPLDFVLQKLDAEHPYLKDHGFTDETIHHFGLGFCSRGMLAGRIAIPLHDAAGTLVGYAGRLADDEAIDAEHPKYLFPGERIKDGVKRVFAKSHLLYNGHRFNEPLQRLIVVEGFSSVWWLHQHGHPHVVGLMGSDGSAEQLQLISDLVRESGIVQVMLDHDPAGVRGAEKFVMSMATHRPVSVIPLGEHRQPTELSGDKLARVLGAAP
jgi:DNA primase